MSSAAATTVDETGARASTGRDAFRAALDAALAEADADERIGPSLRAAGCGSASCSPTPAWCSTSPRSRTAPTT